MIEAKSKIIVIGIIFSCVAFSCKNNKEETTESKKQETCMDDCKATGKTGDLTCKLTTREMQNRRETVLASLKAKITGKKELKDGYAFKFNGSDAIIDELTEFIKTERECCDFFTFNLSISGDKSETWLEIKGIEGAKKIISNELGL